MIDTLAFQFGGLALLPKDTSLAGTRVLKPGTALLLMHQVLTFDGKRDSVRVNVQTLTGMSEASLFILANPSRTAFALPLEGMWYDGAGPSLHTHHRWAVPEEFAHDFTRIGANGLAYSGDGTRLADYYAYGQPVLAAAAGEVIAVLNDEPEDATLLQRRAKRSMRTCDASSSDRISSWRAVRVASREITSSCGTATSTRCTRHLKPASVLVKVGDTVTRGQQIASVGQLGKLHGAASALSCVRRAGRLVVRRHPGAVRERGDLRRSAAAAVAERRHGAEQEVVGHHARRKPKTNTTSDALSTAMSSLTAISSCHPDAKR